MFWKSKKVFITGHTGFKGSWLLGLLSQYGSEIQGFSLPAENNSLYQRLQSETNSFRNGLNHTSVVSDMILCSLSVIIGYQPDVIFHLAAQPLVIESYNNPRET